MVETLKEYGLDKYESMAYLTLLKIGLSTSSIISQKSSVPYGRIYSVLSSLESKGFVKVYGGAPKRFAAIEPRICLNRIIERKMEILSDIKKRNESLIAELENSSKIGVIKPLEVINVIEGKKNYLNLSVKLHKNARKEWRTITQSLPVYKPHFDSYKNMLNRGVEVRILTHITDKNRENSRIWKKLKVKIRDLDPLPSSLSVMDETDVVLRLSNLEMGGYISLHIQNPVLAKTLSKYFDVLWDKATSVTQSI